MTRTQLLIGSIFYLCSTLASKETVKVTLYYETLCPYSIDFINNQLYPGYQKLGDVITLDLIPFGKAKIKNTHGKIKISCQHGRKECYGNKIHACAIQNNTQDVWMNFIGCDMATDHPTNKRFIQKCAETNKLSWNKLKACVEGDEGRNLLLEYGKATEDAEVMYVPHILLNDIKSEKAQNNFLEAVCELFTEKPSGC